MEIPDENWQFRNRDEIAVVLDAHDLEPSDVCLVGSVSLSVRGLGENSDITLSVHPDKRNRIDPDSLDGCINVTRDKYERIDLSDRELIEDNQFHDVIDGFKVVRPEITFSYKKLRDLPKDERDVELLKNYSQATDDWDWDLYRSDYSEPPNTLLSRGIQSLRTDGVLVTIDKVLGLIHRKFPVVRRVNEQIPVYDLQTPWDGLTGTERTVSKAELLNRQWMGEEFASMDLVAYWAAIDAFERDTEPKFDLQKLGLDRSQLFAFKERASEPVRVSQKHRILDTPEFAWLLHDDRDDLSVEVALERREQRGDDWLRSRGFNTNEIAHLHERQGKLLESVGGLFYAILWPPANEYFDEMEHTLGKKVTIYESVDVTIDDITTFVRDIYDAQAHDVPEWSIDWKAEQMTDFPNTVRLLKILLPTPRFHDGVSREMEMVKNDVRHEFVDHFPDEFYLSLIHATDNFSDNRASKAVIEKHR